MDPKAVLRNPFASSESKLNNSGLSEREEFLAFTHKPKHSYRAALVKQ